MVSCTDATPSSGGSVSCSVSRKLAEALFESAPYRGAYRRLDGHDAIETQLIDEIPPSSEIVDVVRLADWEVGRSRVFAETQHINLQETREALDELRDRVTACHVPARHLNVIDSKVLEGGLGGWAVIVFRSERFAKTAHQLGNFGTNIAAPFVCKISRQPERRPL